MMKSRPICNGTPQEAELLAVYIRINGDAYCVTGPVLGSLLIFKIKNENEQFQNFHHCFLNLHIRLQESIHNIYNKCYAN